MPTATPISSTIEDVAPLIGTQWAATWSRPKVPMTVVAASSSGIAAAISEPKTTSRMATVRGREKNSARAKSPLMLSSTTRDRLRSPAFASRTSGWRARTASTARTAAS